MARKPVTRAATKSAAIQSDGQYRINVLRPVHVAGVKLKPRHKHIIKGKHIADLGDAIEVIERVK